MRELSDRVGHGDLTAFVKVDQRYAAFQHYRVELRHPRGGQAHYLDKPMQAAAPALLQMMADGLLDPGGPVPAMVRVGEQIAGYPLVLAPIELGNLRRSASVRVVDNGRQAYNRAQSAPRLTDTQLRMRRRRG